MTETHVDAESRSIFATFEVEASREAVWRALTEPEKVRRWWGCEIMTMPVCEIDLRVGGEYRFVGELPSGERFAFSGEYRAIDEAERLVYTQVFESHPDCEAVVRVTLEPSDHKTRSTSQISFPTQESFQGALDGRVEAGMRESSNRLAALVNVRAATIPRPGVALP